MPSRTLPLIQHGMWLHVLRGIPIVSGLLIFALAWFAPAMRRPDGWLIPEAWTLMVGGVSLGLVGGTWGTRWYRCTGLLGLALVGQACALAMIHAPNYNLLQRYIPWQELLTSSSGYLLFGPLAQTALVTAASAGLWPSVKRRIHPLLTGPRAIILAGMIAFTVANGSWDLLRYVGEVLLAAWILVVNFVNLVLLTAAIPKDDLEAAAAWIRYRFARLPRKGSVTSGWDRLLPWSVALWVTSISAILAWAVFERVPHIPDSVSYLFQAKYFSAGHLYLPAPPEAVSFEVSHIVNDGTKWYAYGSPGWPAVLALGVLGGVPWLVNPVIGGLSVLLAHALLRRLYSRRLAHAAVLLLAVSPWFLFMSASFMAHPVALVWMLLALLALHKAGASGSGGWGVVAGGSLGGLFLTRPLEGMLLGPVVGIWGLLRKRNTRLTRLAMVGLVVASILIASMVFPYNYVLTGRPTYFPHMKWTDEAWYPGADRLGFGADIGNVGWPHLDPLPGHGPIDVILNAHQNFYMANFELFGWSFGSLGFVAVGLLWRGWRRGPDWLFLAIIVAIIIGHSFYWFSGGPDFGARYWYQILIPLVVLTVRSLQELQRRWEQIGGTPIAGPRIAAFVVAASVVAFVNVVPWRSLGKYYHYRGISADMAELAETVRFGRSLVFVEERDKNDYPSAFIFNPPTLRGNGPVFARDVSPERRTIVQRAFPDRPVWRIASQAVPGARFTVVEGPLPSLSSSRADCDDEPAAQQLCDP